MKSPRDFAEEYFARHAHAVNVETLAHFAERLLREHDRLIRGDERALCAERIRKVLEP